MIVFFIPQMEGPWGGPGGLQFVGCCTPFSMTSIEIHHESGETPLIWSLQIGYEYNGCRATTTHGENIPSPDGTKTEKVCLQFHSFLCKNWNLNCKCEFVTSFVFPTCTCLQTYLEILFLQFSLQPHEFLTQVEGYEGITHYHHGTHERVRGVSAITFHTNLKTYGPYGGGKEPNFAHFQSSVGRIVGFCGSSGSIVDSIGVFVSHDL